MFKRLISSLLLVTAFAVVGRAQTTDSTTATVDEKSQVIIDKAIAALGGNSYLNVSTVIGRGFYSTFSQGAPQVPAKFVDYIAYPDRERTEFIGDGIRTIQTNVGKTGWVFDGAVKTIKDQGPVQIESFQVAMRTTL